jgi:ABC-2 type transport system ATP-binding protein
MDSFLLLQKYYEIPNQHFRRRVDELAELLGVKGLLEVHIRKLSLGERMKMELMASLLHQPEIIFLDEPTIGLDIVAQQKIREFLKEYQKENDTTILLTSHYMADVEALCSRIVLILGGQKRFDGPIGEFEGILGRDKFVSFTFADDVDRSTEFWRSLDAKWNAEGRKVDIRIPEARLRDTCGKILERFPVSDFQTEKMPIERVMAELMNNPELIPSSVDGSMDGPTSGQLNG